MSTRQLYTNEILNNVYSNSTLTGVLDDNDIFNAVYDANLGALRINVSNLPSGSTDTYTTSILLSGTTFVLTRNDGVKLYSNLSSLKDDTNFYTTGGTYSNGDIYFSGVGTNYKVDVSSLIFNGNDSGSTITNLYTTTTHVNNIVITSTGGTQYSITVDDNGNITSQLV